MSVNYRHIGQIHIENIDFYSCNSRSTINQKDRVISKSDSLVLHFVKTERGKSRQNVTKIDGCSVAVTTSLNCQIHCHLFDKPLL